VEPGAIFELILKADDALKYATEERARTRAGQARRLLERAREEAAAIGNAELTRLAEVRLADLDRLETSGRSSRDEPGGHG
jgi:hypothetical protein